MNSYLQIKIVRTDFLLVFFFFLFLSQAALFAQGFTIVDEIEPFIATTSTEDKPQSKIWQYGGYWWTIAPVSTSPTGTYLWRLDGTTWTKLIRISTATDRRADVHSVADVTHIILRRTSLGNLRDIQLISVEFVPGSPPTYKLWTKRTPNIVTIPNINGWSENATIDLDSQDRMWLAYDGGGTSSSSDQAIIVRSSEYPYSNWPDSNRTFLTDTAEVDADDICAITAFGGNKIGVFWSDQNARQFRFRYRNDTDPLATWSAVEIATSGSSPSAGVADDHGNLAATSDGTVYAAVKTGYNTAGTIRIGLLVRRPSGTWDPLYPVTTSATEGTRPVLLLNETDEILTVIYTSLETNPHIRYKESAINPISFPANKFQYFAFSSTNFNNATSTKQNIGNEPIILFSSGSGSSHTWSGVKLARTPLDTDNGAGYSFDFEDPVFPENKAIVISSSNSTLEITGAITIEAWVNPSSIKNQSILNKISQSDVAAYDLSLANTGKILFKLNNDSLLSNSNYELNTWTHIAAVYTSSEMRIYINGVLDNSMPRTGSLQSNARDVLIGAKRVGLTIPEVFTQGFDGSLDEVRVWNVARTESQIRDNMSKKLLGSQPGLKGYWRFDEPQGLTVPDYSGNDNYGSIFNLKDFRYTWSGAAIGDESVYDYDPAGGYTQSLGHPDGDTISATGTGTTTGLIIYRVDAPAIRQGSTSPFVYNSLHRYFGVKVFGSGTPTYDVVYNYSGHPGYTDESSLKLVSRENLADNSWADAVALLNQSQHTLTRTGLQGTEFALASDSEPLPVELTYFTGRVVGNFIKLDWRTETEVSNYGFEILRSTQEGIWEVINFIEGHGNSNSPKLYSYSDPIEGLSFKVNYRLKQIDTDGAFSYSNIISVELGVPAAYELFQNYPNPFNPNTNIRFQVPEKTLVNIKVYNSIGEQVAVLVNEEKEPGYYEINFNAQNLASGLYVYIITTQGFNASKKMLLLK